MAALAPETALEVDGLEVRFGAVPAVRGLGLSVAHSIVSEHKGRLWAENRPEGGAVFVIELPVGPPAGEPALNTSLSGA